jgi:hypothetical protein
VSVLRHLDLTQIIVGAMGTLAGILAYRQARAGQRDTSMQQQAANKLQGDQLQLEEFRALIPELRSEADRAYQARDEARNDTDRWRTRAVEAETAQRLAEEHMRRALSDLAALRMIVLDEVARESLKTAYPET